MAIAGVWFEESEQWGYQVDTSLSSCYLLVGEGSCDGYLLT